MSCVSESYLQLLGARISPHKSWKNRFGVRPKHEWTPAASSDLDPLLSMMCTAGHDLAELDDVSTCMAPWLAPHFISTGVRFRPMDSVDCYAYGHT